MGWKPHKLEGCRGLNNFFTRLGVTKTNVSVVHRGDTNVSEVHPGRGSDEGCMVGALFVLVKKWIKILSAGNKNN